jgi:hypothetical protein
VRLVPARSTSAVSESVVSRDSWIAKVSKYPEESVDIDVPLKGQVEGSVNPNAVEVPSSLAFAVDVSGPRQVRDDALRRSFGDFEQRGNFPYTYSRVTGDKEQRVAMIREEAKVGHLVGALGPLVIRHS